MKTARVPFYPIPWLSAFLWLRLLWTLLNSDLVRPLPLVCEPHGGLDCNRQAAVRNRVEADLHQKSAATTASGTSAAAAVAAAAAAVQVYTWQLLLYFRFHLTGRSGLGLSGSRRVVCQPRRRLAYIKVQGACAYQAGGQYVWQHVQLLRGQVHQLRVDDELLQVQPSVAVHIRQLPVHSRR